MKIKPVGQYVLVEVLPVEEKSSGGIVLSTANELKREHGGRDVGRILKFGPVAYKGFTDCDSPEDWGVAVGDLVEFERYNGKIPRMADEIESFKNYRVLYCRDIMAIMEEGDE